MLQVPAVGIVRAVQFSPSGDVAAPLPIVTAQNIDPFQASLRHLALPGRVPAVHVTPSGDVTAVSELALPSRAQKTEPFQIMWLHVVEPCHQEPPDAESSCRDQLIPSVEVSDDSFPRTQKREALAAIAVCPTARFRRVQVTPSEEVAELNLPIAQNIEPFAAIAVQLIEGDGMPGSEPHSQLVPSVVETRAALQSGDKLVIATSIGGRFWDFLFQNVTGIVCARAALKPKSDKAGANPRTARPDRRPFRNRRRSRGRDMGSLHHFVKPGAGMT